MKRSWKSLFVPGFVMALLLFPENGLPCGPSFPEAIFTYETHPGKPLRWYAEGNMGVILPSFARSYLVVAYRYLSERPLSASESKDAVRYWGWALSGPWIDSKGPDKAVKEWLAARERVTVQGQDQAEISPFKHFPPPVYGSYANCLPDAFHTAVLTLQDRAHRFGAGDGYVREWVQAQDQVFSDCDEGRNFPARPAEDSPAWFKADRRYQMAAADLYMQNFDVAIKEFDQIAQDSGSPWRMIAPYLAARTVVRKGTLNAIDSDKPILTEAEGRVQKILDDSSLKAVHPPAHKLMAF